MNEAANKGKTVTILLSETHGWFDTVVRKMSRSKYTHASLSLDGVNFYTFNFGGFVEEHPHHMKRKTNTISIEISITDEEYDHLLSEINYYKENREKYQYTLLGLTFCFLHIPYKCKNKYFCSQFVAMLLSHAGVVKLKKNEALYLPKHLLNVVENLGLRCRVVANAF